MVSRIICGPNTGWSNRIRDPEMWLISSFFMVKCGPTEMLLITSLFLMAKSVALLPGHVLCGPPLMWIRQQ